jgi:prevent-host-death family protein
MLASLGGRVIAELPRLEDLPRQTASDVKNKWRQVVREVREAGSVAITNHSAVEVVLVDAEAYRQLAASAAALKEREASVLDQLSAQFNERLAGLQAPDAAGKAAAVFQRKGRLTRRPKAGTSF